MVFPKAGAYIKLKKQFKWSLNLVKKDFYCGTKIYKLQIVVFMQSRTNSFTFATIVLSYFHHL